MFGSKAEPNETGVKPRFSFACHTHIYVLVIGDFAVVPKKNLSHPSPSLLYSGSMVGHLACDVDLFILFFLFLKHLLSLCRLVLSECREIKLRTDSCIDLLMLLHHLAHVLDQTIRTDRVFTDRLATVFLIRTLPVPWHGIGLLC